MVSNVYSSTSLLIWSKIIRHSDSIALDAYLFMDINKYQSILSASISLIVLHCFIIKT